MNESEIHLNLRTTKAEVAVIAGKSGLLGEMVEWSVEAGIFSKQISNFDATLACCW